MTLHNFFSTLFSCLHILTTHLSLLLLLAQYGSSVPFVLPLTHSFTHSLLTHTHTPSLLHSLTHSDSPLPPHCLFLLDSMPYLSQLCSTLKLSTRRCRLLPQRTTTYTISWPAPNMLLLRLSQTFKRWKPDLLNR